MRVMDTILGAKLPIPDGNGIILDFEASCDNQGSIPRNEMEIIEIGALVVSGETGEPISEFSSFIRPVRHATLTDFCTGLTTITQQDVDAAEPFCVVAEALAAWSAENEVVWWGSWGGYDRNQLAQDVRFHRVVNPLPQPHFNVKAGFADRQGLRKQLGLGGAIRRAGLTFQGTAHRGIDDARNIVRLLPYITGDAVLTGSDSFPPRRR